MHKGNIWAENAYIMRMGNFMCLRIIQSNVMATTHPRVGIFHRTVVPTNYEAPADSIDVREDEAE